MVDVSLTFSNFENLPVEKLTISIKNSGVVQQIPALDSYWVDKKVLSVYERLPADHYIIGAVDAWKSKAEAYLDDLQWLLSLQHHRFWSTVLYETRVMDMLVSFLQEANPPYMTPHENKDIQKLYEEVRRLVLIIFCRLVTNKESKSEWMTKEYMAKVIYDKFIFTIPILWDLCLVYGADNAQHVSKIVQTVFTLQPKYETDLDAAVAFVKEAFKYIILQVNKNYDNTEPPNLPETFKGFSEIRREGNIKKDEVLTYNGLKDLVVHMLDSAMTLRVFLEVYPKCSSVLRNRGFVISIVQVYEYAIPLMYEKLQELSDEGSAPYIEVQTYIDGCRAELIDIFREMIAVPKNAIFSGEGNIEAHIEHYLSLMMDGLSERLLIQDYHACYPVNEDLDMLKQAYPNIDPVKTDFILQAIYSNLEEPVPEHLVNNANAITNGYADSNHSFTQSNMADTKENDIPDKIREESLITEVKDIFSDLGDGFILKCLEFYNFSSERVITSILEDNLDSSLRSLDRNLPIIPKDLLDDKFLETGIERLNVFDGDEFDIMTRDDVDLKKIHKGKKKEKYKDIKEMLNDKSEVRKVADIYSKYNLVCEDSAMYSDEYDDTYDECAPPARDVTRDDIRPDVVPRVLRPRQEEESSSEEEVEVEEQPSSTRNRLDFCSNPEEIRARREANFRIKQNKGNKPPPPRNTDVTGKPKGQGQEKEVLHNREKKEKNKSSRSNHNRRSGAQWKRSQGMMPS